MIIVKIGGGESLNLDAIVSDLAELKEPYMIIHGANALRDRVAEQMGFVKQVLTSAKGYSSVFSDENALDAILMSYSGLRNKRLVEMFQQKGVNAIGLTGLDGQLVQGQRNRGIRVVENGKKMLKRDFSGKPKSVNSPLLKYLIDNDYVPVLTIPIVDETGTAINTENDDVVCALPAGLDATTVLQLIEAPGFMADVNDADSLEKRLDRADLEQREQQVEGRIKRKMHALNKLGKSNVERIIISDGRTEHPITDALAGAGTWIE
jgi:[amino group carrier protein]-L-2-aminoadipate 6-kinase